MFESPHFSIVYVGGYAGTQAAVEDTVADPYMGRTDAQVSRETM